MVAAFADLELSLEWDYSENAFGLVLRFTNANNVDQVHRSAEKLSIDLGKLADRINDHQAYGAALTDMMFGLPEVSEFYTRAVAAAQDTPVHFRLRIEGPVEYHGVRWELLQDPANRERAIGTSQNMMFSRYLGSQDWDWRPVPTREMQQPRALVVIADPVDLGQYCPGGRQLHPVDVNGELTRAQEALASYTPQVLAGRGSHRGEASLGNLIARLDEGFDILYLVAHGALKDGAPLIFLEKDDGSADVVDARQLIGRVGDLGQRPTVILLSSCQSAGTGMGMQSEDGGALAGLGPGLARAGVPAVIAMQGNITMRTAEVFAPAFFEAFRRDGVVDRAVAVARDKVRGHNDWWVPVLFSRLRWGQTRFLPQFTDPGRAAKAWDNLKAMINADPPKLTPVLGPGLADGILGSRQEIALRWVRTWHMPIAEHAQGDLAQVAQYLRVGRNPARVSTELQDYLRTDLRERRQNAQGKDPFAELDGLVADERPEKVIEAVGKVLRERDVDDPYRVVAALPVEVFVTTGWTDLLQNALKARGKQPQTRSFPWTARAEWNDPTEKIPAPTIGSPLVYHLFGRLDDLDSLVLTQDDYFEWLTAWIGDRKEEIPAPVRKALTNRSLLFLGYRLDDWDFRVVFQAIKSFPGGMRNRNHQHIGVQLKPENQLIEPEVAQRYLESYFDEDRVDIYWDDTREFLAELRVHTGIKS
jgi:hypothetical protein